MTNTMRAVLLGGGVAALLDGTSATVSFATRGVSFTRLWQGVASGLLGPASFRHGAASAALGLFFNLAIRYLPALVEHYLLSGAVYGVLVFFFMNLVVIPLSALPKRHFALSDALVPIVVHIFCVGLPISVAARIFSNK
jgi:hypothetical protein